MSEYVPWLDVWITQEKMPMRVRAFCKRSGGVNCIVLNQDLSEDKKYEAVEHELLHFSRGDLENEAPVAQIEK